jgi:hypothetical protein
MKLSVPAILLFTMLIVICPLSGCARHQPPPAPVSPASRVASLFTVQERQTCVLFYGPVQNRAVLWSEDLSLVQALVAAHYLAPQDPRVIVLHRAGTSTTLSPAQLLQGEDFPVQPGDLVEVIP